MQNSEQRYTGDGCLIVSELQRCPFFEKEPSLESAYGEDCFFCKFSDFRKPEYIEAVKSKSPGGILYSPCHNEKNKKSET